MSLMDAKRASTSNYGPMQSDFKDDVFIVKQPSGCGSVRERGKLSILAKTASLLTRKQGGEVLAPLRIWGACVFPGY